MDGGDRTAPPPAVAEPALPILYVDDEPENLSLFELQFGDTFPIRTANSGGEALKCLAGEDIGVVLTDERMPGMSGIDLLSRVVDRWPGTVRVIVSAHGDAQRLLRAINRGPAHEYILKPWSRDDLAACLARGLAMASRRRALAARAETARVHERDARDEIGAELVSGGGLDRTMSLARRAALSDATVLITGETGTGKEVVARAIHRASTRAAGPFVRVNCGALAEGVLESELFGHDAGAFTGAQRARRGRFELAQDGTVFLDEIGDISPKMQVSLLRVLQEREIERVGGSTPIRVNARVLAATHRDLPASIAAGTFREDLYYRLNVVPIAVPPLRERRQDIEPLVRHFLRKHACAEPPPGLHPEVLPRLRAHSWPGNVRELENLVHRALVLSSGDTLQPEDFCALLPMSPPIQAGDVRAEVRDSQTEQLRQVLISHGGNVARAARALGVARTTLLGRARRHGLLA
jgi:DNA-binding NtrC family response regulator